MWTSLKYLVLGSVTGQFAGLPNGSIFTSGAYTFQIQYSSGDGNDVTLTAIDPANPVLNGTNGADTWMVRRNGANLEVYLNSNLIWTTTASSITGQLTINGLDGNDLLTVDHANGDAIPGGGITFHGNGQTGTPGDTLAITGAGQGTVTYNYANANDGTVVSSAYGTITYTGLEPISNSGTATEIIFNLPGVADATVSLSDLGGGMARLASTVPTFETTNFSVPSAGGSITINLGASNQTLTVNSLALNANTNLTINGDAGTDTVNLNGDITFAAGSLTVNAESATISAGADLITSGSGTITLTVDDLAMNNMSTLQSASTVTIRPQSAGRAINLGTETAGSLSLTDEELDRVTAGTLVIGRNDIATGTITVSAAISPANTNTLSLVAGASIAGTGGTAGAQIIAPEITLQAQKSVEFPAGSVLNATDRILIRFGQDNTSGAQAILRGTVLAPNGSSVLGGSGDDQIMTDHFASLFVDGGDGNDSIHGDGYTRATWSIFGSNAGSIDTSRGLTTFSRIENLIASNTVADQFVITHGGSLAGEIRAGTSGSDGLDFSLRTDPIQVSGSASLRTRGSVTNPQNSTSVLSVFDGIERLIGSSSSLPDTMSFSVWTEPVQIRVSGPTGSSGNVWTTLNGWADLWSYSSIETLVGSTSRDDYLWGPASTVSWLVDGSNAGQLLSTRFSNIENLRGDSGSDTFQILSGATIRSVDGGAGTDTLSSTGTENTWSMTGESRGSLNNAIQFLGIENLVGGSLDDTVLMGSVGRIVGRLDVGGGVNALSYSGRSTAVRVDFAQSPVFGTDIGTLLDQYSILIGGNGNDTLISSSFRATVLNGGGGNDILTGGRFNDILIGGLGSDSLRGGAGQDIVIGGRVTFDNDIAALKRIRAEWTSSRSYNARINNLLGVTTGGLNGTSYLSNSGPGGDTLLDDASADALYGEADLDWLIGSPIDQTPDWVRTDERKDNP